MRLPTIADWLTAGAPGFMGYGISDLALPARERPGLKIFTQSQHRSPSVPRDCGHPEIMNGALKQSDTSSRRVIDQAIGVLVGLRGCSPEQAFAELVEAMQRTGLGIGTVATELVGLACEAHSTTCTPRLDSWVDLVGLHRTLVTWPARQHTH